MWTVYEHSAGLLEPVGQGNHTMHQLPAGRELKHSDFRHRQWRQLPGKGWSSSVEEYALLNSGGSPVPDSSRFDSI